MLFLMVDAMWYLQDGASPYFSRKVVNCWIAPGDSIAWPPRSPDLSAHDFNFWDHLS